MRTPTPSLFLSMCLAAVSVDAQGDTDSDRYLSDVAWLAGDGRGVGTQGLAASADWLEAQFKAIGPEPAGENGGYRQRFDAVTDVERGDRSDERIEGTVVFGESAGRR